MDIKTSTRSQAHRQRSTASLQKLGRAWWLSALGSSLVCSSFALAQPADIDAEVEEVIVTGSYIRGTPEDAPNPVSILSRDDLLKQGSPTINELVKNLGISSGTDGETNQFQSNALEGAANVNLRGLGPGRTLVLLNGKRMPYGGFSVTQQAYQQFVNINQIPLIAIERTELLRDGASATYGSDAVAGVVNFITRSDFEGLEISANHRIVEDSDGWNQLGIAFGHTFDNDSHLLLALGYNTRDELQVRDRDYVLRSYADNPFAGWSGLGNPGNYVALGGRGTTFLDPGCTGLTGGPYGGACRFQYTQYFNVIEVEERFQLYGEYKFRFGDTGELTISALHAQVEVPEWSTSPSYPPATSFLSNVLPDNHPGLVQLVTDVNNGAYSNAGATSQCPVSAGTGTIWLPRGASGCPTTLPTTAGRYGGFYIDGGNVRASNYVVATGASPVTTNNQDPALLFIGRILAWGASSGEETERSYEKTWLSIDYNQSFTSFDFSASLSYGAQDTYIENVDMIGQRLTWALNGLGGPNCSPDQDPTTNTGITAGSGDCYYYNPLSNGLQRANRGPGQYVQEDNPNYEANLANRPDLLDWIIQHHEINYTTELLSLEAVFSGDLGGVGWAAGLVYRLDSYKQEFPGFNNRNAYPCQNEFEATCPVSEQTGLWAFLSSGENSDREEAVFSAFGEAQWNLGERLQAQTALRYEEYEDSGDSLDFKVSARLDVTDALSFRGSYSTSFKAPQLAQIGLDNATALSFIGPIGTFKAVDFSTDPGGLDPESAEAINLGLVVQQNNFFLSVDLWQNTLEDPILAESFEQILAGVCPGNMCDPTHSLADRLVINGTALNTQTGIQALTAGSLNRVRALVVNGDEVRLAGLDVNVRYTLETRVPVTFGLEWSRLDTYELSALNLATGTVTTDDHVGQVNQPDAPVRPLPENKFRAYVDLEIPICTNELAIGLSWRFIDGYEDERTGSQRDVDEHTTLDLNASYSFNSNKTRFFLNITDLTDEEPPYASLDLSYDPYTHSPLGRTVKVGFSHRF